MPKTTHQYNNEELTIVWKPDICIHSTLCWKGLREVFDPSKRPWIDPTGTTTEKIIEQVHQCPSGALSYYMNNESAENDIIAESAEMLNLEMEPNGPIIIATACTIVHSDGRKEIKSGITKLCRCGASGNKPFCDDSHKKIGFEE